MASLEGDIKVPGVGKVQKKYAAGGVLVVAVLVGVYYYRKRQSTTTTPTSTSTDQYPPDGTTGDPTDPYSTDPATGQTYGNESVGSGGTFGAFGSTGASGWDSNTGMYTDPNGVVCENPGSDGYCPASQAQGIGGPPFSNNQEWASYAEAQLTSTDPGKLAEALGLYLDGQPVTSAEKTLIFEAQGVAGSPPVAGTNNYPPNIRTNGSTGGKTLAENPVKGLHAVPHYTQADLSWTKSKDATSYLVTISPDGHQQKTSSTKLTLHNLREGVTYDVKVRAQPGGPGGADAHVSFKTRKAPAPHKK